MTTKELSKMKFESVEVFGIPMLFSNGRIPNDLLPDGIFRYDLRGSDCDPGSPVSIEKMVAVNHAATVLSLTPLDFKGERFLMLNDNLNFTGGLYTIDEFKEEFAA